MTTEVGAAGSSERARRLSEALRSNGTHTLGHETNLARAPIWAARARAVQLDLLGPTVLYGREFRQVAGEALTLADQRLFAQLTTTYVRQNYPANRRVPFSLGEGARLLGHHDVGGEQRRLVQASLARLRSCTIKSAVRYVDEHGASHEDVLVWGLLESARITTRGGGRGLVTLSEQVAQLLAAGSVTLLHAPTWDAIAAEDELAARLWCFLEAEDLRRGWRYQLFAGPSGQAAEERNMPAISELLRIDGWSERRRVAQRVRSMCAVIGDIDPRYHLELAKGKELGMWRLDVGPRGPHRVVPIRGYGGLSRLVLGAWQGAYGHPKPSKKQLSVLHELVDRLLGPAWVATHLPADEGDPYGALLVAANSKTCRADRPHDGKSTAARLSSVLEVVATKVHVLQGGHHRAGERERRLGRRRRWHWCRRRLSCCGRACCGRGCGRQGGGGEGRRFGAVWCRWGRFTGRGGKKRSAMGRGEDVRYDAEEGQREKKGQDYGDP